MKPAYKPVPHGERVTWFDHFANHTLEEIISADVAKRVKYDLVNVHMGMLVYEDDRLIVLAHEARVDEDLEEALFSHYTSIYKVCILERKVLK